MNFFEDNLMESIKYHAEPGSVGIFSDIEGAFKKISNIYPFSGSKILWESVDGSIEKYCDGADFQKNQFQKFFLDTVSQFHLSGGVIYLGDSAIDFGLVGDVGSFIGIIGDIFEIPQHHYFVGADFSWCMSFTMEGGMAFGFSRHAIDKQP